MDLELENAASGVEQKINTNEIMMLSLSIIAFFYLHYWAEHQGWSMWLLYQWQWISHELKKDNNSIVYIAMESTNELVALRICGA